MKLLTILLALAAVTALSSLARAQTADLAACVVESPGHVEGNTHVRIFQNTCVDRVWLIVTTPIGKGSAARLGWRRRIPLFKKGEERQVRSQYRDAELIAVCAYGDVTCIAKACDDGARTECFIRE
ncbi:MAG TPA: hypothetical protein VF678_11010 [bacterium]